MALKNPIVAADKGKFDTKRIKTTVGGNLHLKEGDLITTTGWLWLVALEDASDTHRDGDYHIQIRPFESWGDSCLIVEVPYKAFASGTNLKMKCDEVRTFIRSHFLNNREPAKAGSVLPHSVKVTVTGQLFFDAIHINTAPRGKQGMKSYTCWELHPVIEMKLAN